MSSTFDSRNLTATRIYHRLSEFVTFLRARGLAVGIGAEVDLGSALGSLAVLDRADFQIACRTTLAKSPEELQRLDEAFDIFWSEAVVRPGIPSPGQSTALSQSQTLGARAARAGRLGSVESEPLSGVTRFGMYSARAPASGHVLSLMDDRELRVLRRGARRFRLLKATLPGRRFARAHNGTVDFPATLRQSLRQGGEWMKLSRHQPQPRRAELVILWDISGSMREHDARCFALVYSLERVSRSSRVFAFSTGIEEITEEVRRSGYRRATTVVAARITQAEGGTQIGPCLREFSERYGSAIRDRSTVVIVSDGWDLAESNTVAEQLQQIRRRAHSVIWVSPYARRRGFEPKTAALLSALPYVDVLLGPEDFESPFQLRPIVGTIARWEKWSSPTSV